MRFGFGWPTGYAQLPLPMFVGPIPNPRPASQRPVRRDGGEEAELKILTRGVPEQMMIEAD